MNSHAHRIPKNSNPVVDAADCGNPYPVEPTGSKATKQVPLDSYPISPKEKLDSVVLSMATSGLHGGLEDHSSNSDSCVLHQSDACAAPVNNSSSGLYHLKPNGCLLDCIPQQCCSALEAEGCSVEGIILADPELDAGPLSADTSSAPGCSHVDDELPDGVVCVSGDCCVDLEEQISSDSIRDLRASRLFFVYVYLCEGGGFSLWQPCL
ncbi:hypothetical protein Nepgr_031691 [Nepenthes gracilis]|uniref:Uncharacterized protein n=1 Tax=Nepenthes gracilis TaxID=150966 RepID=A0AAD3Y5C4_NEPGR|nr:hypothetical protein Nepgr_031691 [Nepenthes gracilis]